MHKVKEGTSYSQEILYKAFVKVNKPQEGLNISLQFQDWPLSDSNDFNQIHGDFVLGDNQA